MVSFISTLLILVLANGYFTLPVSDERSWSATDLPSFHDVGSETTESARSLRYEPNDNKMSELSKEKSMYGLPHHPMESNWPATTERLPEEEASRAPRTVNDDGLFETLEHTTELSDMAERGWYDSFSATAETATKQHKFSARHSESNSEAEEFHGADTREETITQQPMRDESTISFTTSFPSTVAPQLSSTTKKYLGLFHDNQNNGKVPSTSDDSSITVPTATFDPEAMQDMRDPLYNFMQYDNKNAYVVTDFPNIVQTSTMENNNQDLPTPIPFHEGQKQVRF